MPLSRCVRILMVFVVSISLNGCAVTGYFSISKPSVNEADVARLDEKGILHAEDITISVMPLNTIARVELIGIILPIIPFYFHSIPERYNKPFEVMVAFFPKDNAFTLDPRTVALDMNGNKIYPESVSFLLPSLLSREDIQAGRPTRCDEKINDKYWRKRDDIVKPLIVAHGCYILKYPTITPLPEQKFIVMIDGVKRESKAVEFPPLIFEKDWLMAPVSYFVLKN